RRMPSRRWSRGCGASCWRPAPTAASRPCAGWVIGWWRTLPERGLGSAARRPCCVKNRFGKPLAANALERGPKGERSESCSFTSVNSAHLFLPCMALARKIVYRLSEAQRHPDVEPTAIQGLAIVGAGDLLVEDVVEAGVDVHVLAHPVQAAQVDQCVGRTLLQVLVGNRLALVARLRPETQGVAGAPVQADVEHVLGQVVERLADIVRRGLGLGDLAVGEGVVDLQIQLLAQRGV